MEVTQREQGCRSERRSSRPGTNILPGIAAAEIDAGRISILFGRGRRSGVIQEQRRRVGRSACAVQIEGARRIHYHHSGVLAVAIIFVDDASPYRVKAGAIIEGADGGGVGAAAGIGRRTQRTAIASESIVEARSCIGSRRIELGR